MRIKSYFAETVESAVAQARRELGPEAMLINSRRTPNSSRHLGEYEVVFGLVDGRDARAAETVVPQRNESTRADPSRLAGSELSDLRKEIEDLRTMLRPASSPAIADLSSHVAMELREHGFDAALARRLVDETIETLQARTPLTFPRAAAPGLTIEQVREAVAGAIEQRLRFTDPFESIESRPRLAALIGPAGSGKTSMLVKIAVQYGLARRRSVVLISADADRVAGMEPLRTYGSILGVRFAATRNFGELMNEVERSKERDLVLVDTPGFGPADQQGMEDLAGIFSHFELTTHLVAPAHMRAQDLARCCSRFARFHPVSLMPTRLDETEDLGAVISAALAADLALSLCGNGQSIPEDLMRATPSLLTDGLFECSSEENRSAA